MLRTHFAMKMMCCKDLDRDWAFKAYNMVMSLGSFKVCDG